MPSYRRFNRALRMRPITAEKHYAVIGPTSTATGAVSNHTVVDAVSVDNKNGDTEVREGCSIKAVYFEFWVRDTNNPAGVSDSFDIMIEKSNSAIPNPNTVFMANPNSYPNKKNILYYTRGLANGANDPATPILRGWIKIPRSKQRFGLDDRLKIHFYYAGSSGSSLNLCGFCTYKEYY